MVQIPSLEESLHLAAGPPPGWLGFDRFMELALLHPTQGYYMRTDRGEGPFGRRGDFLTAPEMGPWMGAALAQAFVRLQRTSPVPLSLLELGPGTGALAAQILSELADLGCLPQAYWLEEPSAFLRQLQRSRLSQLPGLRPDGEALLARCHWTEEGQAEAPPLHGLILAHEVFDALPVRRFEWSGVGEPVQEWGLGWDASVQAWSWRSRPASAADAQAVQERARAAEALGGWRPGHRCEMAPGLACLTDSLWRRLRSGALMVVDYGYERAELDHPDRHGGTLAAHLAHRRLDAPQDWIESPGSRDLTAHVDFTALATRLAELGAGGLGAGGLTLKTQAAWLLDHGVLEKAQALCFPNPALRGQAPSDPDALRSLADLQTLLSDGAMGQRFLVLSAVKPFAEPAETKASD